MKAPLYRVRLIEKEGYHNYTIDGESTYYPGATGILDCISKPALVPWAAKETANYMGRILAKLVRSQAFLDRRRNDEDFWELFIRRAKKQPTIVKKEAARHGTDLHRIVDDIINKRDPGLVRESLKTGYDSVRFWLEKEKLKIVAGDTKVVSRVHGFGGSLDGIVENESGLWDVIDFKSGKQIYDTHAGQVGSYAVALRETYGLPYLPGGWVIRFGRHRVYFERRKVRSVEDSFGLFLGALHVYKAQEISHFSLHETVKKPKEKKL